MTDIFETVIEPASYHVLVKQDVIEEPEVQEKTSGGIYIPRKVKDKLQTEKEREQGAVITGTLIKVGPTAWKGFDEGQPWAKVGDHVICAEYAGFYMKDPVTDVKYKIMNDEDVKGILKDGE